MRTRSATPTPPPLLVRRPCGAARRFCARRDSRLRTGRQPRTRVGVRARRLDRLRRGRHWRGMLPAAGGRRTGRDQGMPGRVLEGTDRPGEGGQPLLEATRVEEERVPGDGRGRAGRGGTVLRPALLVAAVGGALAARWDPTQRTVHDARQWGGVRKSASFVLENTLGHCRCVPFHL